MRCGGVIRFDVHVHPGSRTSVAGGSHGGALRVHVRARAVDGAATSEVLDVLADAFGVRVSAVRCVRGAKSHTKSITVEGDDEALRGRLALLLAS
jgi:uncharacterized protein YggU (UPF0235/DUF167 family)